MGKHKEKKRKHEKHKKKKKEKKYKKKYSSDSSDSDEWVEKESVQDHYRKEKSRRKYSSDSSEEELIRKKSRKKWKKDTSSSSSAEEDCNKNQQTGNEEDDRSNKEREEWMSLSTTFSSTSHLDKRKEREMQKNAEREKQIYDPRTCSRELNPYWKEGGDGLPKFRKPTDEDDVTPSYREPHKQTYNRAGTTGGWRKNISIDKSSSNNSSSTSICISGSKYEQKYERKEPLGCTLNTTDNLNQIKRSSSESNSSPLPDQKDVANEESPPVLSDKELNHLAAKLVKAEIMGNTKLAEELKNKLEAARNLRANHPPTHEDNEEVILTHTDSKGFIRPVIRQTEYDRPSGSREKKQKVETHRDGQRVRYFADDDKYSLQQMFENEKYTSIEDSNKDFLKMASKVKKNDDLDDIFEDKIRHKESDVRVDEKNRDRAINEHQRVTKSLDNCNKCIQSDNMLKHLMISMGETVYIALPPHEPVTEGHCFLIPIRHTTCATQLDENEWCELLDFRKALTKMFNSQEQDPIFFETAMNLNKFNHMYLECVPVPREQGDVAPIYFKKAIDESEFEWSQNKKLVSLKGRDVRRAIPKGLPYFAVSFGMEEGYAHVIEEEKYFPRNFAQEIIGGMLDLDHSRWRKPKRQSFEEQSRRVTSFTKLWCKFDITKNH